MSGKIETNTCTVTLLEADVLRIEYKRDCFVEAKDMEENLTAYRALMTSDKAYLLTIANAGAETSPEVRDIFASKKRSDFKLAEAFVISSLAQKIVANFVMKVQKPGHLLRFFTSEKEAREWLYKQKETIDQIKALNHKSVVQVEN